MAGQNRTALRDTGFNGDLPLPEDLRNLVNPRPHARQKAVLATGESIEEDVFLIELDFDGQLSKSEVTFAQVDEVVIGTHLMRHHRLEINFVTKIVLLERVV